MANVMQAKEFTLIYDSSVVAYATSFDLKIAKNSIDVTTLSSAGWNDYIMGDKDWTIGFDGLVCRSTGDASRGYNYIVNQLCTSDASVVVAVKPNVAGNTYLTGVGYIDSINLKGGVGDKATFTGSIRGTGALSSSTA